MIIFDSYLCCVGGITLFCFFFFFFFSTLVAMYIADYKSLYVFVNAGLFLVQILAKIPEVRNMLLSKQLVCDRIGQESLVATALNLA